MKVVNLIPTYNEAENIGPMLQALAKMAQANRRHQFLTIVVDDNSPDGTGELAKKFKQVQVLSGSRQGLGMAMVRGLKYVSKNIRADVVVTNECDFAYHPNLIPRALKLIEDGNDVVIGSRHVSGGATTGWTWQRRLNHWVANTAFATWLAGVTQVSDHNGAFRAIRINKVLKKINWTDMPTGFAFFNYWLYKMTLLTDKIVEMPINYQFRRRGESKISFNPKYFRHYVHDVGEYIKFCVLIRLQAKRIEKST